MNQDQLRLLSTLRSILNSKICACTAEERATCYDGWPVTWPACIYCSPSSAGLLRAWVRFAAAARLIAGPPPRLEHLPVGLSLRSPSQDRRLISLRHPALRPSQAATDALASGIMGGWRLSSWWCRTVPSGSLPRICCALHWLSGSSELLWPLPWRFRDRSGGHSAIMRPGAQNFSTWWLGLACSRPCRLFGWFDEVGAARSRGPRLNPSALRAIPEGSARRPRQSSDQ
jgi:hypothetical protein